MAMISIFSRLQAPALLLLFFAALHGVLDSWRRCQLSRSTSSTMAHLEIKRSQHTISNIALLGQFNYDVPADRVVSWVQIWSKYFSTISVVGPFSRRTYSTLRHAGIDIHLGAKDKGCVSPVKNLMEALQRAPAEIDAVIYIHDDGLLNLTNLSQGQSQIPTDRVIGNLAHIQNRTYSITVPSKRFGNIIYDIPGHNSTPTLNQDLFLQSLPPWHWNRRCVEHQRKMLLRRNSDVQTFAATTTDQGSQYFFAGRGQMDFLLVPTMYKDLFARIARLFIDDGVFLECAFPTIILWLLQEEHRQKNGSAKNFFAPPVLLEQETTFTPVCTSWNKGNDTTRGTVEMIEKCLEEPVEYGMYHPVKLSTYSASEYSQWLDRLQQPAKESTI